MPSPHDLVRRQDGDYRESQQDRDWTDVVGAILSPKSKANCQCGKCVRAGAILREDREWCSLYVLTLNYPLGGNRSRHKVHEISYDPEGDDSDYWEGDDIEAQLLPEPDSESGEGEGEPAIPNQKYRLRLTSTGDPRDLAAVTLILYRLEEEDELEEVAAIPAGPDNPLAIWKNVGFVRPLCGFQLNTWEGVDPDLGLTFNEGCSVCVNPHHLTLIEDIPCIEETIDSETGELVYTGEAPEMYRLEEQLEMPEEFGPGLHCNLIRDWFNANEVGKAVILKARSDGWRFTKSGTIDSIPFGRYYGFSVSFRPCSSTLDGTKRGILEIGWNISATAELGDGSSARYYLHVNGESQKDLGGTLKFIKYQTGLTDCLVGVDTAQLFPDVVHLTPAS
ncbi:hypothetical protein [Planctomicrobium sp. SH664]|uniref:hypothetical protein n=1 Tax=Planctomicrobium sp. SH664 TaxID=3448125 RepID=UPI003F5C06C7